MSLLSLVQDAAVLCGLVKPASAASATDLTTMQLVALSQEEGDELSRRHDWRALKVPAIVTGNGMTTAFSLPADFDRLPAGNVLWRRFGTREPVFGPVSDAEWVALQNNLVGLQRRVWRLEGGKLIIWPALAGGEIVDYQYLTLNWITSADGVTPRARWVADDDKARIPERLVMLGLRWRWRKMKGLAYAEDFRSYQMEVDRVAARDTGERVLSFGPAPGDDLPTPIFPDTIPVP